MGLAAVWAAAYFGERMRAEWREGHVFSTECCWHFLGPRSQAVCVLQWETCRPCGSEVIYSILLSVLHIANDTGMLMLSGWSSILLLLPCCYSHCPISEGHSLMLTSHGSSRFVSQFTNPQEAERASSLAIYAHMSVG